MSASICQTPAKPGARPLNRTGTRRPWSDLALTAPCGSGGRVQATVLVENAKQAGRRRNHGERAAQALNIRRGAGFQPDMAAFVPPSASTPAGTPALPARGLLHGRRSSQNLRENQTRMTKRQSGSPRLIEWVSSTATGFPVTASKTSSTQPREQLQKVLDRRGGPAATRGQ